MLKKILFILLAFGFVSCAQNRPTDEPYNRYGSRQAREAVFRYSVFAAYEAAGQLYANYAMAELVDKAPDEKGFYTVRFTDGPYNGAVMKTRDVILKTLPASEQTLRRGVVVIRDFWASRKEDERRYDKWNKAVVSDVSAVADGKVMLEFPRDPNDFMANKETVYLHSVRVVVSPALRDPRTYLP